MVRHYGATLYANLSAALLVRYSVSRASLICHYLLERTNRWRARIPGNHAITAKDGRIVRVPVGCVCDRVQPS